jgi:hypothetical protein
MREKPHDGKASKRVSGQAQETLKWSPDFSDAPGSTQGKAQVIDPVRDRIDSDWAPGVPNDPSLLPTMFYQAGRQGVHADQSRRVHRTRRGTDRRTPGSTISGVYLGGHPPGSLVFRSC